MERDLCHFVAKLSQSSDCFANFVPDFEQPDHVLQECCHRSRSGNLLQAIEERLRCLLLQESALVMELAKPRWMHGIEASKLQLITMCDAKWC